MKIFLHVANMAMGLANKFWPILGSLFLTLKLVDLIDWPWYWVLSPLWISAMIYGTVFAVLTTLAAHYERVFMTAYGASVSDEEGE